MATIRVGLCALGMLAAAGAAREAFADSIGIAVFSAEILGNDTDAARGWPVDSWMQYVGSFNEGPYPVPSGASFGIFFSLGYQARNTTLPGRLTSTFFGLDPSAFYVTYVGAKWPDFWNDPWVEPGYERADSWHPLTSPDAGIEAVWYARPRAGYSWDDDPDHAVRIMGFVDNFGQANLAWIWTFPLTIVANSAVPSPDPVPEPSSAALLGLGCFAFWAAARRMFPATAARP